MEVEGAEPDDSNSPIAKKRSIDEANIRATTSAGNNSIAGRSVSHVERHSRPIPAWYVACHAEIDRLLSSANLSTEQQSEIRKIFQTALDVGLAQDNTNAVFLSSVRAELKAELNKKPSYSTVTSTSTAASLPIPQVLPKTTTKGLLNDPNVLHKNREFYFTINLGPRDLNQKSNITEVRNKIHKILEPKKYNIRCSIRLSKAGNAVLSFPTIEEKEHGKKILRKSEKGFKLNDMDEKLIPIWVKDVSPDVDAETFKDEILQFNPILEPMKDLINEDPSKPYVKWIGVAKKKMRVLVPRNIANFVLVNGFLYSSMIRHRLTRLNNLPQRCQNCLRLHFHKSKDCKNPQACAYCGESHSSETCPVKDKPDKHKCTTCKHHNFYNPISDSPIDSFVHNVFDKECPAWKDVFCYNVHQMNMLLKDAPGP